jgi:hypothetical protein
VSRLVRRRLAAALRQTRPAGWWETTAVLRLPSALSQAAPVWSPEPGYVEALTATVWAYPSGNRIAHAVVVVGAAEPGGRVIKSGPVGGVDVMRWGGLVDKPHRISWLAHTPPVTWHLDDNHPALSYQDWLYRTADDLDRHYRRQLRARHLHANQVQLLATPGGGFQATVAIQIVTGPYRRYDITAHAAALSALLRRLGPGTRLRFHPAAAEHLTDPLSHHAWRLLAPPQTPARQHATTPTTTRTAIDDK